MSEIPLETSPATIFNYLYSNKAVSKEQSLKEKIALEHKEKLVKEHNGKLRNEADLIEEKTKKR